MKRHPLSQRFHDILQEMGELHDRKQADYGRPASESNDGDPFANIRGIESFGLKPWVGAAIRMGDKKRRIEAAARGQNLVNESIEDSFLDMAVYAVIGLILFREGNEKINKNKAFCDGKSITELADEMTKALKQERNKIRRMVYDGCD